MGLFNVYGRTVLLASALDGSVAAKKRFHFKIGFSLSKILYYTRYGGAYYG
jgi:hypothetical protein